MRAVYACANKRRQRFVTSGDGPAIPAMDRGAKKTGASRRRSVVQMVLVAQRPQKSEVRRAQVRILLFCVLLIRPSAYSLLA